MAHERSATVDGHVTRDLEAGRGRPLILLHAFPLSADMWQSQLDRVPDGWRFIAPDLRGFGAAGTRGLECPGWGRCGNVFRC